MPPLPKSQPEFLPRFIRLRDAPRYLGMEGSIRVQESAGNIVSVMISLSVSVPSLAVKVTEYAPPSPSPVAQVNTPVPPP